MLSVGDEMHLPPSSSFLRLRLRRCHPLLTPPPPPPPPLPPPLPPLPPSFFLFVEIFRKTFSEPFEWEVESRSVRTHPPFQRNLTLFVFPFFCLTGIRIPGWIRFPTRESKWFFAFCCCGGWNCVPHPVIPAGRRIEINPKRKKKKRNWKKKIARVPWNASAVPGGWRPPFRGRWRHDEMVAETLPVGIVRHPTASGCHRQGSNPPQRFSSARRIGLPKVPARISIRTGINRR